MTPPKGPEARGYAEKIANGETLTDAESARWSMLQSSEQIRLVVLAAKARQEELQAAIEARQEELQERQRREEELQRREEELQAAIEEGRQRLAAAHLATEEERQRREEEQQRRVEEQQRREEEQQRREAAERNVTFLEVVVASQRLASTTSVSQAYRKISSARTIVPAETLVRHLQWTELNEAHADEDWATFRSSFHARLRHESVATMLRRPEREQHEYVALALDSILLSKHRLRDADGRTVYNYVREQALVPLLVKPDFAVLLGDGEACAIEHLAASGEQKKERRSGSGRGARRSRSQTDTPGMSLAKKQGANYCCQRSSRVYIGGGGRQWSAGFATTGKEISFMAIRPRSEDGGGGAGGAGGGFEPSPGAALLAKHFEFLECEGSLPLFPSGGGEVKTAGYAMLWRMLHTPPDILCGGNAPRSLFHQLPLGRRLGVGGSSEVFAVRTGAAEEARLAHRSDAASRGEFENLVIKIPRPHNSRKPSEDCVSYARERVVLEAVADARCDNLPRIDTNEIVLRSLCEVPADKFLLLCPRGVPLRSAAWSIPADGWKRFVLHVARCISRALRVLHGKSWLANDVRISNVVIVPSDAGRLEDGTPVLIDLGGAVAIGEQETVQRLGDISCTADHMIAQYSDERRTWQPSKAGDLLALAYSVVVLLGGNLLSPPWGNDAAQVVHDRDVFVQAVCRDYPAASTSAATSSESLSSTATATRSFSSEIFLGAPLLDHIRRLRDAAERNDETFGDDLYGFPDIPDVPGFHPEFYRNSAYKPQVDQDDAVVSEEHDDDEEDVHEEDDAAVVPEEHDDEEEGVHEEDGDAVQRAATSGGGREGTA